MAILFKGPGFTRRQYDRPDERLRGEIEHSKDFDVTTGETWEEKDRELEKLHSEGVLDKHKPGKHPYGVVDE